MSISMTSRSLRLTIVISLSMIMMYGLFFFDRLPTPSTSWKAIQQTGMVAHEPPLGFLPAAEAEEVCKAYKWAIYPQREQRRKIYDLFMINTELDWLDIRLNELHEHVDYFVIVEATRTFTNNPKPLHLKENWHKFKKFHKQIIYHPLNLDTMDFENFEKREHYIRNSNFDLVFPGLIGEQEPHLGDIMLISDIDELPKPSALVALRNCNTSTAVALRGPLLYYSFQWKSVSHEWNRPQATYYQGLDKTIRPEDVRQVPKTDHMADSSWHCSCCFSTVAQVQNKMASFAHSQWNTPKNRDPAEIVRRVRNGLDIFGRASEKYERRNLTDIPEYLKRNPGRFAFMLDRDPENANFRDYQV